MFIHSIIYTYTYIYIYILYIYIEREYLGPKFFGFACSDRQSMVLCAAAWKCHAVVDSSHALALRVQSA